MKIFAFIMAFLVLVLPVLPCADDSANGDTGEAKMEVSKQDSHEEEQNHDDACSPFCHCTCCAGLSITHFFPTTPYLIHFDRKVYLSYLPENILEASHTIWQPPRIS